MECFPFNTFLLCFYFRVSSFTLYVSSLGNEVAATNSFVSFSHRAWYSWLSQVLLLAMLEDFKREKFFNLLSLSSSVFCEIIFTISCSRSHSCSRNFVSGSSLMRITSREWKALKVLFLHCHRRQRLHSSRCSSSWRKEPGKSNDLFMHEPQFVLMSVKGMSQWNISPSKTKWQRLITQQLWWS